MKRKPSGALLRALALVSLLAIASGALLPSAHPATEHAGECGVCALISGHGSSLAPSASALAGPIFHTQPVALDREAPEHLTPSDFEPRRERAPPSISLFA